MTTPPADTETPLLEVHNVTKSYGHVLALRGVSLTVPAGQVVGLIGDNGAGKSTLVKMLSGAEQPDSGSIRVRGRDVIFTDPLAAQRHGIETVFQDLALAPDLDAASNLYLGRERRQRGLLGALGWMDRAAMRDEARSVFSRLGVEIANVREPIATYSGGQRQGVAVARAAYWAHSMLILDEPTAALGVVQTKGVLDLIRRVRDSGISVLLISHNMPDVMSVCDRITVLRLGTRVADIPVSEATTDGLVSTMTGASTIANPSTFVEATS